MITYQLHLMSLKCWKPVLTRKLEALKEFVSFLYDDNDDDEDEDDDDDNSYYQISNMSIRRRLDTIISDVFGMCRRGEFQWKSVARAAPLCHPQPAKFRNEQTEHIDARSNRDRGHHGAVQQNCGPAHRFELQPEHRHHQHHLGHRSRSFGKFLKCILQHFTTLVCIQNSQSCSKQSISVIIECRLGAIF